MSIGCSAEYIEESHCQCKLLKKRYRNHKISLNTEIKILPFYQIICCAQNGSVEFPLNEMGYCKKKLLAIVMAIHV